MEETEVPQLSMSDQERKAEAEARHNNKFKFKYRLFTAVRETAIIASGFITVALVHEDYIDLNGWGDGNRQRNFTLSTSDDLVVGRLGQSCVA